MYCSLISCHGWVASLYLNQKAKLWKKQQGQGEKVCKIKGGGQEMVVMMLITVIFDDHTIIITNDRHQHQCSHLLVAPLISQVFSPSFWGAAPFFHSLAVLV